MNPRRRHSPRPLFHPDILARFPTARTAVVYGFGLSSGPGEEARGALVQIARCEPGRNPLAFFIL